MQCRRRNVIIIQVTWKIIRGSLQGGPRIIKKLTPRGGADAGENLAVPIYTKTVQKFSYFFFVHFFFFWYLFSKRHAAAILKVFCM